jgi:hypothetical protein
LLSSPPRAVNISSCIVTLSTQIPIYSHITLLTFKSEIVFDFQLGSKAGYFY